MIKSKITGGPTEKAFSACVLKKYEVTYYRCLETGFIQTEDPYWLKEAYSSAITKLDIGIISRNELLSDKTVKILSSCFDGNKRFLDYAGGYGVFTRMMRDRGYDFYHTDLYCENVFAKYFDLADCPQQHDFELLTAFEVFEHLVNPLEEIQQMTNLSDNLLFTTELQPAGLKDSTDWWYITPETGQHIAFYTKASLEFIAGKLGFYFLSDRISKHLFTRKKLSSNPFEEKPVPYLIRTMRRKLARFDRAQNPQRESLLMKDFNDIKAKLNE